MKRALLKALAFFLAVSTASYGLSGQTQIPTRKEPSRPRTQASTYRISGRVTISGTPARFIVMTGLPGNPLTNRHGQYSALVESDWTGTVTPTLPGARFRPIQRTYVYVKADQPDQDYTISRPSAPVCFYKHLLLLYPNSDISYYQDGAGRQYTGSLTSSHQEAIVDSFKNIPYLTIDQSGNTVFSSLDIKVIGRALTTISPIFDHSYWVEPGDIQSDLDSYAPEGRYDSVHVVWNSGPMASEYWGLGGMLLGMGPKKTTYSCLIAGAEWWWVDANAVQANIGGVFLHEWLHGVCAFYRSLGYAMPERDADGAELHGYTNTTPEGWAPYYRDLMQGKVWEPSLGRYTGIGPRVWNDNSTSRHHGVYGQILTERGAPLPGVKLKFANRVSTVSTRKGGYYFQIVPDGWSGTVTPSLAPFLFNPPLWIFAGVFSNQPVLDFVAILGNHPPVFTPIPDKTIKEGEELAFSVSAEDPDRDVLIYSASGLPAGATFRGTRFHWKPDYTQAGIYTVAFVVKDGHYSVSMKVGIVVLNVKKRRGAW